MATTTPAATHSANRPSNTAMVLSKGSGKGAGPHDFVLHRCVFENDITGLYASLKDDKVLSIINDTDKHGNTALNVALMLGRHECADLLLRQGASTLIKTKQGWLPISEAISFGKRSTVRNVLTYFKMHLKEKAQATTASLIEAVTELEDLHMVIQWDFHSWLPLVTRFLPSDTLHIWKDGLKVRMDSTLISLTDKTIRPGNMTYIFEAFPKENKIALVTINHDRQQYFIDLLFNECSTPTMIDSEVDLMLLSDLVDIKMSTKTLSFTKSQRLFRPGPEAVGKFMGHQYAVSGTTLVTRKRREHLSEEEIKFNKSIGKRLMTGQKGPKINKKMSLIPPEEQPNPTWQEYTNGDDAYLGREQIFSEKTKTFKPKIWMTEDFPLSVDSLVKLLSVISPTSERLQRLKDFVANTLPTGFPVKIDMAVFPTVSARVTFEEAKLQSCDKSIFSVPKGYVRIKSPHNRAPKVQKPQIDKDGKQTWAQMSGSELLRGRSGFLLNAVGPDVSTSSV